MVNIAFLIALILVAGAAATNTSIPMHNAAAKDQMFPVIGFGTRGPGYQLGQKDQCYAVNATREYVKLAYSKGLTPRIDVGYPYGDNADCPNETDAVYPHTACNTMGITEGFAGPMGYEKNQIDATLQRMKLDYIDLCLIHEPEVGPGTGAHGAAPTVCNQTDPHYSASGCRVYTWQHVMESWQAGSCRAIGVNNWNVSDVKDLEDAGLVLPSVVQYKFHLHQSTASSWQRDLMKYSQEKNIIFNGIAPLATPDWVTFVDDGMQPTTLEEPTVKDIAKKVNKTAAQVLQKWIVQQGIAIQTRSTNKEHMEENLDMFDWELDDDDMQTLSTFPQCNTQRGSPYMDGDPEGDTHGNVIGMTQHC